jgi:hypothetical protein
VLPTVTATRYVTPLREGGSLPGLMEADDLGTYVVKFRGAGQGRKALVAEVVCAGLARGLGLPVPDLALVAVDPVLAAGEPDEEVQDLLRASGGLNLGVDFLPGALDFDLHAFPVAPDLAGRVLWFDALVNNVDRSWRNPNLLVWHGGLHLIDHGAALTFHHQWSSAAASINRPYDTSDHVLIGAQPAVDSADDALAMQVTPDLLWSAVADIPDEWLAEEAGFTSPTEARAAYVDWLAGRLAARDQWLPGLREAPSPRRRTGRPAWLTSGARGSVS